MKRSDNKSEYLLIRAGNENPMDCVDFALIHATDEWKQQALQRYSEALPLLHSKSFEVLRYNEEPVGYFCSVDEFELEEILPEGLDWIFVELEEGELEQLDKRHGELTESYFCIDDKGKGYYSAKDDEIDQYGTFAFDIPTVCNH